MKINKYQHIIDTLLDRDKIHTVSKPKSNWRYKVYPKPRIWVDMSTLKQAKKYNKLKKKKDEISNRKSTNVWANNNMGQRF
jgi:hypothetical protein